MEEIAKALALKHAQDFTNKGIVVPRSAYDAGGYIGFVCGFKAALDYLSEQGKLRSPSKEEFQDEAKREFEQFELFS